MCVSRLWIGVLEGVLASKVPGIYFGLFPRFPFGASPRKHRPISRLVWFAYMVVDVGVPWIGGIRGGDSAPGTWELWEKKLNFSFRSSRPAHLYKSASRSYAL